METTGPVAWEQVLQKVENGALEDVGNNNLRAGVREEKWTSLDLKSLTFPATTVS